MEKCLDNAMNKEIGIAADRRSEVAVVLQRESEMSLRSLSIDSLCHLRKEESRETISLSRVSRALEMISDMPWLEMRCQRGIFQDFR